MMTTVTVAIALLLDACFGEPRRFHPLVGFGKLAHGAEQFLFGCGDKSARQRRARGALAVFLLVVPFAALAALTRFVPYGTLLDAILLYLAIGWKSLAQHARPVLNALRQNQLDLARERVGKIVSRDTASMQAQDVSKATVESVLENGNDAVFGAIFWFVVAGAPGAVAYRLANTLDAMWGYRNERYLYFGWAAARLDDVLNFVPARLTALGYALVGRTRVAFRCWQTQGRTWKSPNAGPVMAAGAGSLGVSLGGPASYHGTMQTRPPLGEGRAPEAHDIERSLTLLRNSLLLWVLLLAGGNFVFESVLSR